jgi:ABC-type sugar transport system substrate-binding protein
MTIERNFMFAKRKLFTCAVILGLAATLAACGSSSKSASSSGAAAPPASSAAGASGAPAGSSGASSDPGLATAQALLAKYSTPPASLGITTPVPNVPTGKKIDVMDCGSPSCADQAKAFKAAAAALGWSVTDISDGSSPDTVNAAWQQVERNLPDGVAMASQPTSVYASALADMASHNIPVVDCCSDNTPTSALKLSAAGADDIQLRADLMAAEVIVNSNGTGSAFWVSTPAFPSLVLMEKDFDNYLKTNCSKCAPAGSLPIAATDIGSPALPTKIVGYVRAHQGTNYIVGGFDDELIGLPAAMSQANLTNVKVIGENPTATTLPYLKAGTELASVTFPLDEYEWLMADALARLFVGASVTPDQVTLPLQMITSSSVTDLSAPPQIPNYQGLFKQLWGKS